MRLAEHLAVLDGCLTTLAPSGYVVGVHLRELIQSSAVVVVAKGAERAV